MLDSLNIETIKPLGEKAIELFIESYSNSARTVQVRGLTKNEIVSGDHTTSGDRSLATSVIAITEMPISLTVRTAETSVSRGECYVKVSLRVEGAIVALLFSGYVTDAGTPAYPNGKTESSVEGPGLIRSITGTNPAAGVLISETVPTGARWRIIYVHTDLVTDATVANRAVALELTDGVNDFHHSWGGASATASTTTHFTWGDFGARDTGNSAAYLGMAGSIIKLIAGFTIDIVSTGFQAGDNFGAPQLLVEEWIEP